MAAKKEVVHSKRYEYVKKYYGIGVSKEQAKKYVKLNALFDWEYEEIVGEPYEGV